MTKTGVLCAIALVFGVAAGVGSMKFVQRDKLVMDMDEAQQFAKYFFVAGAQRMAQACRSGEQS